MDTFLSTKSQDDNKFIPSQALGAMGWYDEGNEIETPLSSIVSGATEVIAEAVNLVKETAGIENTSSETQTEANKLAIGGQTELNFKESQAKIEEQEKNRKETDRKKAFFQVLKDDQLKTQMAKDKMWFEEAINDMTSNMSTEEKNELLHLQADYTDNRNIYHKAELRRKIIEQRRKADQQQKAVSIPSPAKQPSALEGAFEGRSGNQGSGTANLSANAAG